MSTRHIAPNCRSGAPGVCARRATLDGAQPVRTRDLISGRPRLTENPIARAIRRGLRCSGTASSGISSDANARLCALAAL